MDGLLIDTIPAYVSAMVEAGREQFRLLFLDKRNQLIADEVQQADTVDHTPVYPRETLPFSPRGRVACCQYRKRHRPREDPNCFRRSAEDKLLSA